MSTEPENLVLEHLRMIRTKLDTMHSDMRDMMHRQAETARQIAGLRRDQASDAENTAYIETQIEKMRDQIDRIKRRLDITD